MGKNSMSNNIAAKLDTIQDLVINLIDTSEKTVDGCHPTDYGFISMAEYLYPIIKKILAK